MVRRTATGARSAIAGLALVGLALALAFSLAAKAGKLAFALEGKTFAFAIAATVLAFAFPFALAFLAFAAFALAAAALLAPPGVKDRKLRKSISRARAILSGAGIPRPGVC
jgi:hypothetical protein